MATYKVIQDIEAEDKLVGPLTLRQFIYAAIAAVAAYICVLAAGKGAAFLIVFFLPIVLGAGFFAFPWKGEQPTEIWALARLRFQLKPRVRIWDQDGVKEIVSITAPKKIERRRSPNANLTQTEVRSRLKALADTIDSRGWATRNAAYGIYGQQWAHPTVVPVPGSAPVADVSGTDIFDAGNTVAQNFDAMLTQSSTQQRRRVEQFMANPQPRQPSPATYQSYQTQSPQLPSPIMPAYNPQSAQQYPQQQPAQWAAQPDSRQQTAQSQSVPSQLPNPNNYWFASGPAYPTAPQPTLPVQPQQQVEQVALPAPTQTPAAPQLEPTAIARPGDPSRQGYNESSEPAGRGMIESDAPVAVAATPTPAETQMGEDIRRQNEAAMAVNYAHMRVLQPSGSSIPAVPGSTPVDYTTALSSVPQTDQVEEVSDVATPQITASMRAPEPVTRKPDPAILELANNDDLDIATIARQANKQMKQAPDEVEIRLR
jgi:hypothetical protein